MLKDLVGKPLGEIVEECLRIEAKVARKKNDTINNEEKTTPKNNNENYIEITKSNKSVDCWGKVIGNLKESGKIILYTNLMTGKAVEINDMTIGIEFQKGLTQFGKNILEKPENINEICKLFSMEYGKPMQIKIIDGMCIKQNKKSESIDCLSNDFGMPINIIDE